MSNTISKPVNSLYMKAYVSALDAIDTAEKKFDDSIKQPQKVTGEAFLKTVIDLALAKAQMTHLQDSFIKAGGKQFSFTN